MKVSSVQKAVDKLVNDFGIINLNINNLGLHSNEMNKLAEN